MAKRKSIGQKARFEIFKRDGFKCSYCGRSPPDVLLQVDHVIAVANGGTNDDHNLTTACQECNAGKSANPLTSVAPSLKAQASARKEMAKQVREYTKTLLDAKAQDEGTAIVLSKHWFAPWAEHGNFMFTPDRINSVRIFLGKMSVSDIIDSMDSAHSALASGKVQAKLEVDERGQVTGLYDGTLFRYFCGVCWNKIKGKDRLCG